MRDERIGSTGGMNERYSVGDVVVVAKEKHGTRPGRRARSISAAPQGEHYHYFVDKYWVVVSVEDAELVLKTPGGKLHRVSADDAHLRPSTFLERLRLRLGTPDRWHSLRSH